MSEEQEKTEIVEPEAELLAVEVSPEQPNTTSGGRLILIVLVLLAMAAGLGGGWLGYQSQLKLNNIVREQGRLTEANTQLRRQLGNELDSRLAKISSDLNAEVDQFVVEQQRQTRHIDSMQAVIDEHRQRLLELSTTDRKDWLLAEVEYLLRLANQRVLMAKDVVAAQALLRSADNILAELKDVSLHSLRSALATDLAALRAAGDTDIQGVYLRLHALIGEIETLPLFVLPDAPSVKPIESDAEGWRAQLDRGVEAALNKFGEYVTIRHREDIYNPAMSPEWEGLARQNLRMMLEHAQSALLSGNAELYKRSLGKAQHWVGRFFTFDERAVKALNAELNSLLKVNVAPTLPDISSSLMAVKNKLDDRHQISAKTTVTTEVSR